MSKAIVVCCDGVWKRSGPGQTGGTDASSNIQRCVSGLKAHSGTRDQVIFYDGGADEQNAVNRWLGGVLSLGLSGNMLRAYRFIAQNWAPGDDVYLLGFSRGAYVVRSLAGFIHEMGLIDKANLAQLPRAYQWYRTLTGNERNGLTQAPIVEELRQSSRRVPITFLGVFDTVGSSGIPVPGLGAVSRSWVGFHDTELSDTVSYAVQALGIDEQSVPLRPDLWTFNGEDNPEQVRRSHRHALQVWLPGDHSDMGGVGPPSGLADVALRFMIAQTSQHGLAWRLEGLPETLVKPDDEGAAADLTSVRRALGVYNRPIGAEQRRHAGLQPAVSEKIHSATIERLERGGTFANRANLMAALEAGTPVFHERRHQRQTVPEALAVADMPNIGEVCTLLDLSQTGARIRSSTDRVAGERLRIRHPRVGDREGRVLWCEGREAGVEFAA